MRAAFYECDITPPLGCFLWGHYEKVFAQDVYEPIFAKAMVAEDGGELAAILCVDTCALTEDIHDIVTKRVYEYTGIAPERVLITSDHSHTGAPVSSSPEVGGFADESYKDVFFRRCADAVILAYKRLGDVQLRYGATEVYGVSFNRNFVLQDGTLVTHGRGRTGIKKALGGIDPELSVLMFERDGKPIGAVINFACHQCSTGFQDGYSGDYSSIISQKLKEQYGNDFVSLFVLGTCGDINHVNPDASQPLVQYKEIGQILAAAVLRVAGSMESVPGGVSVIKEKLEMDRREMTAEQIEKQAIYQIQTGKMMRARNLIHYAAANDKKTTTLVVQVIRIGDVCITALPGEVYSAYGLAIKAASPFRRNLVIENCNCYCGYIPTKEAFADKSEIYEISLCFHSNLIPEAGQILQDKALEMINKLK